MTAALIGLGSNRGQREKHIASALADLDRVPGIRVVRPSSLYESAAVDGAGSDFLNAAALIETTLSPRRLLWHLLLIEARQGRERSRKREPRPIDLDLLCYADRVIEEPDLTVPHPAIAGRPFVLAPLAEVAADFSHPVMGRTFGALAGEASPECRKLEPGREAR